jgi:hypothetical protein
MYFPFEVEGSAEALPLAVWGGLYRYPSVTRFCGRRKGFIIWHSCKVRLLAPLRTYLLINPATIASTTSRFHTHSFFSLLEVEGIASSEKFGIDAKIILPYKNSIAK